MNVRRLQQREAVREYARESLARRDFEAFCQRTDLSYIKTRHTRVICQHIQALADNEIQKLMIFMPPRHGKTYHASERFPAYFEGINRGSVNVILASYTIDRARASSRKVRELFKEATWPFVRRRARPRFSGRGRVENDFGWHCQGCGRRRFDDRLRSASVGD